MTDSSPTTEAPSRDDFIRAAEERIYAARQSGDVFMATAIRVELLTMWDEGRREAVRDLPERMTRLADSERSKWHDEVLSNGAGESWVCVPIGDVLDAASGVAGLEGEGRSPIGSNASESPPPATCCGHFPHGNGPCHGMVADWGGKRIPCDCDGQDASESPPPYDWACPKCGEDPEDCRCGAASESPPPEYRPHQLVRDLNPSWDASESPPTHDITDPNAPPGWQCGDPACRWHGLRDASESPLIEAERNSPDRQAVFDAMAAAEAASEPPPWDDADGYVDNIYGDASESGQGED